MLVILDIVIGISFVYLLLALICTTANEWIAGVRRLRARTLEHGVRQLLGPLADAFFGHPVIKTLSAPGQRPSYIPAHVFSSVVLDLLGDHPAPHIKAGIDALSGPAAARTATHAAHAAALEDWYNTAMDRVSGWYKRRIQAITVGVAIAVTLVTNADTLRIIGVLWRSPTLREAVVAEARGRTQEPAAVAARYPDVSAPVPPVSRESSAEDIAAAPAAVPAAVLDQLVGWSADFRRLNQGFCSGLQDERDRTCGDTSKSAPCQQVLRRIATESRCTIDGVDLLATDAPPGGAFLGVSLLSVAATHAFGWLLTIVAISLGAAFWFDTLKRFVNIRGAGPSPSEKKA